MLTLASHLTERDRNIAKDCFEFRVLTTSQITRPHFTGSRTASARLDVLYRLRVLDRFRPSVPLGDGTAPYHWILDEGGALIVADHLGRERSELGWRHSVAASIATSQNLAHHVEVNEFLPALRPRPTRPEGRCRSDTANGPAITRFPAELFPMAGAFSRGGGAGRCISWSSSTAPVSRRRGCGRRPRTTKSTCRTPA